MALRPDVPSAHERIRMQRERAAQRELFEQIARRFPDLRDRRRGDGEGAPVDPDRPSHLSGGAASALDLEED